MAHMIYLGLKVLSMWVLWGLSTKHMGTWTLWGLKWGSQIGSPKSSEGIRGAHRDMELIAIYLGVSKTSGA